MRRGKKKAEKENEGAGAVERKSNLKETRKQKTAAAGAAGFTASSGSGTVKFYLALSPP